MILYDENGEFLGISSETVSFLGYEDINEFLSLYSDFADLLVEKEGKIYKFKNFSWIEFILYSGAPNKSAIVKLKDGSEADIRLTVKEIILAKEMGGIKKCYSVRIISDEFVKIASKVDSSMKFKVNDKKVSLNNLISDTSSLSLPNDNNSQEVKEKDLEIDSLSINYEDSKKEKESINFDFPPADELKSTIDDDLILDLNSSEKGEEDIKFDFENSKEDESKTKDLVLDFSSESNPKSDVSEINESKSKDIEAILKIDKDSHEDKDNKDDIEPQLSFLKDYEDNSSTKEIDSSSESSLSFLKIEDDENLDEDIVDKTKEESSKIDSLDFLKIDDDIIDDNIFKDKQESLETKSENSDKEILSHESKEEVIKQIKSDLKEIDKEPLKSSSEDDEVIIKSGDFIRRVFS